MTGWRLGYASGPHKLMQKVMKIYQHSASCVTAFALAGALEGLTNPETAQAVKGMVDQFNRNRELMMDTINHSSHLNCVRPQGAFYCFVSYDKPIISLDLASDRLTATIWLRYQALPSEMAGNTTCVYHILHVRVTWFKV